LLFPFVRKERILISPFLRGVGGIYQGIAVPNAKIRYNHATATPPHQQECGLLLEKGYRYRIAAVIAQSAARSASQLRVLKNIIYYRCALIT
jgi:hypothetical protein